MNYVFKNTLTELSVCKLANEVSIGMFNNDGDHNLETAHVMTLNKDELFDLIGALHSIKAKIEKEAQNGTN